MDIGSGDVMFINCTFADNSATFGVGGAIRTRDTNSSIRVRNSILWNNTAIAGDPEISGDAVVSYCDIQGGWTGEGSNNIDVDPVFAAPQWDNYQINFSSPCKDTGSNALLPPDVGNLDWDCDMQETVPDELGDLLRIFNGTVDRGAYEINFDFGF